MCSLVMQMAFPRNPTKRFHNSDNKSSTLSTNRISNACHHLCCSLQLNADQLPAAERRSGNYSPSRWDVDYIQSLHSEYKEERHKKRASELVMQVKKMVENETDPIRKLELIDELQRLGLSQHLQNEFKQILNSIYLDTTHDKSNMDLYSTALAFRLLRQHDYQVGQDVFDRFKNEEGEFKQSLIDDERGMLQLYEASFLLTEGESTLELAREFSTKVLQQKLVNDDIHDSNLVSSIRYSLDIPIHWRIERLNTSVWIDAYKKSPDMNPTVLELAILDSNVVQAQYQEELKQVLQWWRNGRFAEKLPFVRDRLVESYYWGAGIMQPRQLGMGRMAVSKSVALITVIDDVYDVYGTLEELQQFTQAIRRWDIGLIDQLPSYMQLCFLGLDNYINDTAYDVLKEQGFNIIPYLRKSWTDLVEAYLVEAKWYHSGYKPSLEEYMKNSWTSVSGPVVLTHAFFGVTQSLTKEAVDRFFGNNDLVRCSSMIFRLADDLGTSSHEVSRGDVPKSIQCYMKDNNATEEEAREYVKWMIGEMWKTINKERVSKDSPFCKDFIECAVDMGRMAQYMYHYGDGHGLTHNTIYQNMTTCFFHPST